VAITLAEILSEYIANECHTCYHDINLAPTVMSQMQHCTAKG